MNPDSKSGRADARRRIRRETRRILLALFVGVSTWWLTRWLMELVLRGMQ
jgi:hypothetical protein